MRDSLTVLAIILIALLTTALVGPYFVDWNAHRGTIEARLSALAGAPVSVRGPIDLKLLPKPVFRLGAVAIGAGAGPFGTIPGTAAPGPSLTAEAVEAELSLPALMRGQVQVVDATLVAPHLDLAQQPDGAVALPRLSPNEADRVSFDHVGIRDGAVTLQLADGRTVVLAGIDLDAEATTLRGPFKARGSVGAVPLRVATGALEGGHLRVKLGIEAAGERPSLDLDGTLTVSGAPLAFAGTLAAAGALPLAGTPATVPWRATAEARADAAGAAFTEVEIRAGDELRALILDGAGSIARGAVPGAAPEVALTLHGAGLDLDALATAPKDGGIAPPQGLALLGQLARAAGADRGVPLPLALAAEAGFDTVTTAGRTFPGATLKLGLGSAPGTAVVVTLAGPEGARLALDGTVLPGPAFRGRADAAAADPSRLAAWLRPIAPDAAAFLAADVPARSLALKGVLDAAPGRIALKDATVRIGGTPFAGEVAYDLAAAGKPPRLAADLRAESLDLDAVPALDGSVAPGTDLDIALAAPALRLSGAAVGAGGAPIAGGPLALHVRRSGETVDLDRFSLVLGGATVTATGSRSGTAAKLEARLDAPALAPLSGLFARLAPGPLSVAIAGRAAALSPALGTIRAEASAGSDGTLVPTALAFDGTLGGTHLSASLAPGEGAGPVWSRPLTVTLEAAAPDAAVPLRALGFAPVEGAIGAGTLHATARGTFASGLATNAQATLGATALTFDGRVDQGRGQGKLTLATPDLRPLLVGFGILPAGPAAALPANGTGDLDASASRVALGGVTAEISGATVRGDLADAAPRPGEASALSGRLALDRVSAAALVALGIGPVAGLPAPAGAWSSAPFAPVPALPRGEVALAIGHLPLLSGLEAQDATMSLRVTRTGLELSDIAARLGEGSIGGEIALQRDGATATLRSRLRWRDLALALDALSGRIGGTLDLAGSGASPAALVRSLGGTGTLDLGAAALAQTDPAAVGRTLASYAVKDPLAEPDPAAIDPAGVTRRLASELDRGPLPFGRQALPLLVAGGIVTVAAAKPEGGAPGGTEASLGLGDLSLTLRTRLAVPRSEGPASGGSGGDVVVTRQGTAGATLARQVDAVALVDRLRAEAVARAQERIDVMEQDLRERAYFNRVLKAIQADQAAARQRALEAAAAAKAAADARQADAARAKAEEARVQAQVEAAARVAAAKAEAEKAEAAKQRFIDQELQDLAGTAPPAPDGAGRRHPHIRPHASPDLIAPPSIVDEGSPASGRP